MQTYSPWHVSAVVICGAWLLIAVVGLPDTRAQDWQLGWEIWVLLVLATLGPLVVTNILWFRALHRIGPARATLATNLQPFVAAVLAVVLLSEPLDVAQIAGGALIAGGIFVARRGALQPTPPRIGSMTETDFMPLGLGPSGDLGWEREAGRLLLRERLRLHAHRLRRPETGVRDRASYALEQGDIRFVLTSGLRADSEICKWAATKGDSVRDVALAVPDASNAYRQAVQRGARGVAEPHWVEDEHGRVELAAIATYGDNIHTFVNRSEYSGPYLPGYQAVSPNGGGPTRGVGLISIDHVVGTSSSAAWTSGSTSTRACSASRSSPTSPTRTSRPSTPRSCRRS